MRNAWSLVGVLLLFCSSAHTEPKVGLFGLLCNVHAYTDGQTVYVPLLGLAEWAGATVEVRKPDVYVALDDTQLKLTIGSGVCFADDGQPVVIFYPVMEFGGCLCVPARFWEKLGFTVNYVTQQTDQYLTNAPPNASDRMDGNPVLVFSRQERSATVLIHAAPPDAVAKFVADFENSYCTVMFGDDGQRHWLGRYGIDWIAKVNNIMQGYFQGCLPAEIDEVLYDEGVLHFWSNVACVYGLRQGKWQVLMATQSGYKRKDWTAAGIPLSLAKTWREDLY